MSFVEHKTGFVEAPVQKLRLECSIGLGAWSALEWDALVQIVSMLLAASQRH